ncbi:MAG: DUF547 domain-containing protein [Pirellulaceae bacterium]|nr:MAG: DUF547 domain-containing protein [Pirellulaceae bacterium]
MTVQESRKFWLGGAAGLYSLFVTGTLLAGPVITVGVRVAPGSQIPAEKIDHSAWDALLQKYVDSTGFVDYSSWKAAAGDQRQLESYLNHLSTASISPSTPKAVQLAFWINAYNALTIHGILREYPTSSIRNHTARLFGYNIWKDLQLLVNNRPYSLEEIEHQILRKMQEPRIHFAIVCASVGCPRLLNRAYTAEKLEEQLSANATAFFADSSKFRVDVNSGVVYVSPIFDWFGTDFGPDPVAQLQSVLRYLPEKERQFVSQGRFRVKYLDYDWSLNDQARRRVSSASRP